MQVTVITICKYQWKLQIILITDIGKQHLQQICIILNDIKTITCWFINADRAFNTSKFRIFRSRFQTKQTSVSDPGYRIYVKIIFLLNWKP